MEASLSAETVRCDPESSHDSQPGPRHNMPPQNHVSGGGICHTRQEFLAQIDSTNLEQEQLSPRDLHRCSGRVRQA